MDDQFAETKEIISEGFKRSGEEHNEILDIISETKYILMQKDVAKFLIKIKAPLISSVSPISGEIEIPIGNLTEAKLEEKAEEIISRIKCVKEELRETVKREFLDMITRIPVIGAKLLKRLEKTTD